MSQYRNHRADKHGADSIWRVVQALLTLLLVLCGLIGIAVHLFSNTFSLAEILTWLMHSPLHMALTVTGLLALIAFHRYNSHVSHQRRRGAGNLPVYLMMTLGAFFLLRLATTGQW